MLGLPRERRPGPGGVGLAQPADHCRKVFVESLASFFTIWPLHRVGTSGPCWGSRG